jgi:hypothetical protein
MVFSASLKRRSDEAGGAEFRGTRRRALRPPHFSMLLACTANCQDSRAQFDESRNRWRAGVTNVPRLRGEAGRTMRSGNGKYFRLAALSAAAAEATAA